MAQKAIRIPDMRTAESDWEPITGLGTWRGGNSPGRGKVRFTDRTVTPPVELGAFRRFLNRWVIG